MTKDAEAWFREGMRHVEMSYSADYRSELVGDLEDALVAFDRSLALQGDHLEALMERAKVLSRLGRHDDAVGAFEKAIRLRPEDVELRLQMADSLRRAGRHEEALAACEKARAKAPERAEGRYLRAQVLDALSRSEDALAAWEEILREPEDVNAGVLTGSFRRLKARVACAANLARVGRQAESVAAFRALLEREQLREVENDFHAALGSLDAAREAYWRHLAARPDAPAEWLRAGSAFLRASRATEAMRAYQTATRLAPANADAWWGLAEALVQAGQPGDSVPMFDEALRIRPDYLGPKARRAVVLRQIALAKDPDDSKRPGADAAR